MGLNEQNASGQIGGVSLASFLQILEQERKSCILSVHSDGQTGSFYFDDGELIDAECGNEVGQDAVYALLRWNSPSFRVREPEDRIRRISQPLAHLLLNAATRQDEENETGEEKTAARDEVPVDHSILQAPGVKNNPVLQRLIETIVSIAEVKHYYLLSRQGKVIVQSSKNTKIPDFITYCVVSGIQMRKALAVKGPHRIQIKLDNGEVLLVQPGAGMIIGLQLATGASVPEVTAKLRPGLSGQSES